MVTNKDENQEFIKDEKDVKSNKYISLGMLGGVFAVLTTLLQVDFNDCNNNCKDVKVAVTIFCVVLPFLVIDIYSLNKEEIKGVDGVQDTKRIKSFRRIIWLLCIVGFIKAFNHIPNSLTGIFHIDNVWILLISTFIFLLVKISPSTKRFYDDIQKGKAKQH